MTGEVEVRHVFSCPRRAGADYCWCDPETPGNTHFSDLPRDPTPPGETTATDEAAR